MAPMRESRGPPFPSKRPDSSASPAAFSPCALAAHNRAVATTNAAGRKGASQRFRRHESLLHNLLVGSTCVGSRSGCVFHVQRRTKSGGGDRINKDWKEVTLYIKQLYSSVYSEMITAFPPNFRAGRLRRCPATDHAAASGTSHRSFSRRRNLPN